MATEDLPKEVHALVAEFKAFRELMMERDARYNIQFNAAKEAVTTALTAQKESTREAFLASEKAISKAEEAQKSYNQSHNDLARKMDDQNKLTMPRTETESRFSGIEEKINNLMSRIDKSEGGGKGMERLWGWVVAAVMMVIATISLYGKRGG